MSTLPKAYRGFQSEYPKLYEAYEFLGAAAAQVGPIDTKYRELIKLGMSAAAGMESAVHSHTHRALEAGASQEEIEQAILIGITTIGFPRTMAALTWAKQALNDHNKK
jgi:4-carboxymuconolactone decarboxylase